MAGLAQRLGLRPKPAGRLEETAAREAALARLQADGTDPAALPPGTLVWNAAGQAVWRFRPPAPIPGAPALVLDVDAATGLVVRATQPPR